MKRRETTLLVLSIILPILFTSCLGKYVQGRAEKYITIELGAIPPDFGKDNSILLYVLLDRKGIDNDVMEVIKEEYHGQYEFVTKEQFKSEKYKDTEKYRYVYQLTPFYSYGPSGTTGSVEYEVLDRLPNNSLYSYRAHFNSSLYKAVTIVYINKLEELRVKYQNN